MPSKGQKLGKKFLQNFISNRGGSEKHRSKAEKTECKRTTLHLLCIFCRCEVVLLHSFISCFCTTISFCTFLYFSPSSLILFACRASPIVAPSNTSSNQVCSIGILHETFFKTNNAMHCSMMIHACSYRTDYTFMYMYLLTYCFRTTQYERCILPIGHKENGL